MSDIEVYRFVAACLSGNEKQTLPIKSPDALLSFASSERLLPALYPCLRDLKILGELPYPVVDTLAAVYQLNLERNQVILSQAETIAGLLNSVGIEPVALKGLAYILAGIFPDPAIRYLFDLDFMIPARQLSEAIHVLSQAGYAPYAADTFAHFRHHAPPMQRADSISIELHHSIGLGLTSEILSSAEIISGSTLVQSGGNTVRLPSPDHLVTHLILHSQVHHSYRDHIFPPPRAMYDLLMMIRHFGQEINWRAIQTRFRDHGQETTLTLHLLQVHETLGMPLPFPLRLGTIAKLRWLRRRVLFRMPALRFLDPYYLFMSAVGRRFRLIRAIFAIPGGWKEALKALSTTGLYRRLLSNL